ncbi:hypothetical protein ISS07_05155 [Candidatus Woesearchaeota archaeon]|nr:hypothetical protein [Candidatus Woesearchaeota archaeon]
MAFFTPNEIVDLIVMTVAIGYIFSKIFGTPQSDDYDPLKHYKKIGF